MKPNKISGVSKLKTVFIVTSCCGWQEEFGFDGVYSSFILARNSVSEKGEYAISEIEIDTNEELSCFEFTI